MNPHLKNFLAGLLGIVSYKALNFILGPDEFVFAKEALEAVLITLFVTVALTLFNRWRAQPEEGAS